MCELAEIQMSLCQYFRLLLDYRDVIIFAVPNSTFDFVIFGVHGRDFRLVCASVVLREHISVVGKRRKGLRDLFACKICSRWPIVDGNGPPNNGPCLPRIRPCRRLISAFFTPQFFFLVGRLWANCRLLPPNHGSCLPPPPNTSSAHRFSIFSS